MIGSAVKFLQDAGQETLDAEKAKDETEHLDEKDKPSTSLIEKLEHELSFTFPQMKTEEYLTKCMASLDKDGDG